MSNNLILSVTIPTYNPKPDYLRQAIESVLNGGLDSKSMELLVVDNCSDKVNVLEVCKSYPLVQYFKNENNLGMTGNWNRCIELAKGEYIHILHDDDYVVNEFYLGMKGILDKKYYEVLLADYYYDIDGFLHKNDYPFQIEHNTFKYEDKLKILKRNYIQPPAIIIKKRMYVNHGGFNKCFYPMADWEVWSRMIVNSKYIYITNELFAVYRICESNTSTKVFNSTFVFFKMLVLQLSLSRFSHIKRAQVYFDSILWSMGVIENRNGKSLSFGLKTTFFIIKTLRFIYLKIKNIF